MNIQSINNDYNVSMYGAPSNGGAKKFWNKLKQKALDTLPNKTFRDDGNNVDRWEKITGHISEPAKNRIIMGATALTTQPLIDYYNHRVDDETRTVSRNRTIAKILAGTFVGAIVRGFAHKGVVKMTDIKGVTKMSKFLIPEKYAEKMAENEVLLKNFRSTVSTSIALGVMLFTNFLLDAPLTIYLTNKFNSKSNKKPHREEVKYG